MYVTFSVHQKEAKYDFQRQLDMIKSVEVKDPLCMENAEIGMDYSDGYSKFKDHQLQVLKYLLLFYVDKKLWSKVLVIHCLESDNRSRDASNILGVVMSYVLKDDVTKMLKSTDTVIMEGSEK